MHRGLAGHDLVHAVEIAHPPVAGHRAALLDGEEEADRGLPPASGRIEMADLKERIRKLEAIAAGIDI
jgi:hypothetical protein